jgi:phosphoribosyl-ATP pyrophosphohydrolase/phosphoribosyl-AMP cyclohydrolase
MNRIALDLNTIDFSKFENGLIPAVIQDVHTLEVRMVGFMNRDALEQTLQTGRVTFWSRSKNRLWQKGETSGNGLSVQAARLDCDRDTVLIQVDAAGPTCHTGERTCFGASTQGIGFLGRLLALIQERYEKRPAGSYTTELFETGQDMILAKVEEEAEEVVRAGRSESDRRLAEESGDLLYHLMVLWVQRRLDMQAVIDVLEERHRN